MGLSLNDPNWKTSTPHPKGKLVVHVTRSRSVQVPSFAAASEAIRKFWGGSSYHDFYADPKAGLIEENGTPIAHISYNGRVWEGADRTKSGTPEIKIG